MLGVLMNVYIISSSLFATHLPIISKIPYALLNR